MAQDDASRTRRRRRGWRRRGAALILGAALVALVYVTNALLTDRFTETTRNRAEVRVTLYAGSLISELQRASVVPQLLSRDPALIGALNSADYSQSTQRLLTFVDEIGAASLMLLDLEGRSVAATDRNRLGEQHHTDLHFVNALRRNETVFTVTQSAAGGYQFIYSRQVETGGNPVGVIAVEVDLAKLERSWAGTVDAVVVTNAEGRILLSTEPTWRGQLEANALAGQSARVRANETARSTEDWSALLVDTYLRNAAVLRTEQAVGFRDWRMVVFTPYSGVRDRVNTVLALEIMGFAILLAAGFWAANRKTASRMVLFQRESAELRELNQRLQREIAERQKVEKDLQVAEQTLAQSSKLAALGEMSAAVSHELNQPLAAMKTYLAGAKLLLNRKRSEEALASFQRIDDLIERMGAITKQLKSYARKGRDEYEPVDVRAAVSSALSLMEPQFKARSISLTRTLPSGPVMIFGDRLRLEQVIINLVRNAVDATKGVAAPRIEVLLAAGETVTLSVRDNGPGIADLDALFEPFYTTKEPGDGIGLGLAISSGIVKDFGGRMKARNAAGGGAVFELQLPIWQEDADIDGQGVEAGDGSVPRQVAAGGGPATAAE